MSVSQIKVGGAFFLIWSLFMVACYLVLNLFFYSSLVLLGLFSLHKIFICNGSINGLIEQLSFYEICLMILKKAYSFLFSWEVNQRADLKPQYEKIFDDSFSRLRQKYMEQPSVNKKENLTIYD